MSSNGTDIDETAEARTEEPAPAEPHSAVSDGATSPKEHIKVGESAPSCAVRINFRKVATKDAEGNDFRPGSAEDDHPSSVIHAPKGFEQFVRERDLYAVRDTTDATQGRSEVNVDGRSGDAHAVRTIRFHHPVGHDRHLPK